ncbi:MAG: outer membrane protein assembly factor BamA [Planctomycetota bacterium]|nr:MAG: outer membrane protein assembly factor BamA [Planctomycetota bacterium]
MRRTRRQVGAGRERGAGAAAPARRRLVLALLLLLAAALAPAAAHAQALARPELEGQPVREIRFEGARRTAEPLLRAQIRLKVGEPFRWATLNDDVKRLYQSGRVAGDIEARAELAEGGVRVTFRVTERDRIVELLYPGLSSYSVRELREASPQGLRLQVGQTWEEYRARLDEQLIVERLREKGKFFAQVETRAIPVAPGEVRVVVEVREGPTVRVEEIQFLGNVHVPSAELRDQMLTRTSQLWGILRSGYFDRRLLDVDLDRLGAYYRGKGFLDARAMVDELIFSRDRSRVTVVIRIVEGERYQVRRVEVRGTTLFDPEVLARELRTRPGRPLSGRDVEADLREIRRRYQDRGYIFARVGLRSSYVEDRPAVDLTYEVEEGTRITIEKIRIVGNTKTRDDVIRRELSIFPGEVFSAQKLDESRDRLGRRGWFEDLQVGFEPGTADDRRDLVLRVREARTGQVLFGGGLSSSTGFFGRVVLVQRNFDLTQLPTSLDDIAEGRFFAGGGQTLVLLAEPGSEVSRYRLRFVEPYLFPSAIPFPLQLRTDFDFATSLVNRTYDEDNLEGELGLGYRFERDGLLELSYRATLTEIFNVDVSAPADVIAVAGTNRVSAVALALSLDKNQVDQHFVGYGGFGLQGRLELAARALGGEFDFWRVTAGGNWQTTLWQWPGASRHVLHARLELGFMAGFGGGEVPVFERFYAGGPRSLRGFEFRSVGPQADDEPIGGKVRALGTLEYSFPIVPGFDESYAIFWRGDFLRGVLFVDAGSVESRIRDFSFDDVRVAVGFGFRIKVPLFPQPVALDFGFPLRKLRGDDPEVFSFSIGAPF